MDSSELIQKRGEKTFLDNTEITPEIINCVYFFMYSHGHLLDTEHVVHDIYVERRYWDPDEWPSSLPPLSIISLENIAATDLLIKHFSTKENIIIPEIKLLYLLALEYGNFNLLDSIQPSEDLFAQLDSVFPDAYRYNLPFAVKMYHRIKEKKLFNTIRFK